jgi:RNA 2',3'-cyclic 3'-phosphodiesterase
MIRLFIAVDLPETIVPFIAGMGGAIPGSRPVPKDQLHLTLKFIGDTDTGLLPDIKDALHSVEFPQFSFQLCGVGHFPPRGMPRVLWAGIRPAAETVSLRNKIETTLADIGIEREHRKFSPHLTLCRLKNSPLKRVTRFLSENALFNTPEFDITEFKLYSSILTPKGAVHTTQEIFQLSRCSQ